MALCALSASKPLTIIKMRLRGVTLLPGRNLCISSTFVIAAVCGAVAAPSLVQAATAAAAEPNGTFVDKYGTSFTFSLCGEQGTDLCGVLNVLKGKSATEENVAFVGKQVMQAVQTGSNEWKGALEAGGISAAATVTMTSANTIDIQGCRSILCQTLTYTRS